MVEEPEELKIELKQIGRVQYHRFRRMAAMLHYYRIDAHTIEDRLVERGCSRELSEWIVKTASEDVNLAKRAQEDETPEPTSQVILKGLNGFVTLFIVFLVARYLQVVDNLGWLFVLAPILLIASLLGSLMMLRSVVELRRRLSK